MSHEIYSITAKNLSIRGREDIPEELLSSKHLIYSSPATLAFNSPGAQGFGVKRAGLAIPGSVMLLVAPGCCGRNTTMLSEMGGYADRFFYLLMDDTDIVTGRHLNRISKAVKEVADSLNPRPSAVMICITCVDALLGTDMERVCRRATDYAGLPVLPCYMYALTREGRVPPMTAVRKTVYQLLEKKKRKSNVVNILGEFAPFFDDCELYDILKSLGVKKINEISRCQTYEEYLDMAEANFNLVLNPQTRMAAEDLNKRLNIPYIELTRLYQIDKIHRQYQLLGGALGVNIDDQTYMEEALGVVDAFNQRFPVTSFVIGESLNADSFELALALLRYGHRVKEIYGTVTPESFVYINKIAELSPDTKIYSNLSPTMLYYDMSQCHADISIGKDASYYHPDGRNVFWSDERQPFGYCGLKHLFEEFTKAMEEKR